MSKMVQLGGFLGRLPRPLVKTTLRLKGNVLKPLAKSVLAPLGLTEQHQQQMQLFKRTFLESIFEWRIEWHHENS